MPQGRSGGAAGQPGETAMPGDVLSFPDRLDQPYSPKAEPSAVIILPVVAIPGAAHRKRRGQRVKSTPEQVELRRQDRRHRLDQKQQLFEEANLHAAIVYLARNKISPADMAAFVNARVDGDSSHIVNHVEKYLKDAEAWLTEFAFQWNLLKFKERNGMLNPAAPTDEPFTAPPR